MRSGARLECRRSALGDVARRLLDYHRREAKPEWWAYFDRRKKSVDELLEDTESIAYLKPVDTPPLQYARIADPYVRIPASGVQAQGRRGCRRSTRQWGRLGTIEWIDAAAGRLGLRRGPGLKDEPLPEAVIAGGPIPDKAQRNAIQRVADAVIGSRSPYRAVEDILAARPPRFSSSSSRVIQTIDLEQQKRLVAELDEVTSSSRGRREAARHGPARG